MSRVDPTSLLGDRQQEQEDPDERCILRPTHLGKNATALATSSYLLPMNVVSRALRSRRPDLLLRRPPRQRHFISSIGSHIHQASRNTRIPKPTKPHHSHTTARRSAIDPLTLLVTFAFSTGVAYLALSYTSKAPPLKDTTEDHIDIAPSAAILYPLTMAPSMPPGRPGTLTAEQETKLKEMWSQTLEIFGVSHDDSQHANGTSGTSTPTTTDSSPDAKKKKKGRLSVFHRRDKSLDATGGVEGDNDKHGQTKEFQQALASLSPEQIREAFWSMSKHDHPDALLLRFLRARKWDVQAALVMMISTLHWRMQEMHVDDDIMLHGEGAALRETKSSNAAEKKEGEDFMAQLRMGKSFLHGIDKEGRPCCYVRVRLHRQGEQSERSLERFTVYTIETARMMLRPPVDTAVSNPYPAQPVMVAERC